MAIQMVLLSGGRCILFTHAFSLFPPSPGNVLQPPWWLDLAMMQIVCFLLLLAMLVLSGILLRHGGTG